MAGMAKYVGEKTQSTISLLLFCVIWATTTSLHPYYIGVTEIKVNDQTQSVEVGCKLNLDDFQQALHQQSNQKVNLIDHGVRNHELINVYLQERLKIKWGNNPLTLKLLGWDIEEEGVWCYFESKGQSKTKTLSICNRALFETLPSQTHFLHYSRGSKTQHWKITNPENCHTFDF